MLFRSPPLSGILLFPMTVRSLLTLSSIFFPQPIVASVLDMRSSLPPSLRPLLVAVPGHKRDRGPRHRLCLATTHAIVDSPEHDDHPKPRSPPTIPTEPLLFSSPGRTRTEHVRYIHGTISFPADSTQSSNPWPFRSTRNKFIIM